MAAWGTAGRLGAKVPAPGQPTCKELDPVFAISLELLCVLGRDGFLKRLNTAWERALGFSAGELMAKPLLELIHPDDRQRTAEVIRQIGGGAAAVFENRIRTKQGAYRCLQWASAAMPGKRLLFALARDVTERVTAGEILKQAHRELENDLRQRSAALQETNQALARSEGEILKLSQQLEQRIRDLTASKKELEAFTYSVSHDLRAPLRHMDGFSKILMEEYGPRLPDEARPILGRIRLASQRMGRMVDELLELSRTGRREPEKRLTGLRPLVEEAAADLAAEAVDREVEWRIGDLPSLDCDPGLTRQVFVNLLSNALKFTRPRHPAVIEVGRREIDGEQVLFVRDNGVGFSMKYAPKLFGAFQRLHRKEDFEGTGVGLATVHRIIQKHGGRIWAEAEVDRGAAFFFTLGPRAPDRPGNRGEVCGTEEVQDGAKRS